MTKCSKCTAKIVRQLWIVDGVAFCSPFCERSDWDHKEKKYTTKFHKHGDSLVKRFGLAGVVKENRRVGKR